jgi:guanylate kinase
MNMTDSQHKRIVCITGTVWTGSNSAPRKLLVKDGFERPAWFTTGHAITDAQYQHVSHARFHQAVADDEVLVHTSYGSDQVGILRKDFQDALANSKLGILIVGPQEIVAQIAQFEQRAVIFTLKTESMDLSHYLTDTELGGRLHRVDVDFSRAGAWSKVHAYMLQVLGLDG